MNKPHTFKSWCIAHRKALKRGYRKEWEAMTTEKSYQDWAADLYQVYLNDFYNMVAA